MPVQSTSRFFPTAQYAEDQPLSRTILSVHVLTRGATTGALIGSIIAIAQAPNTLLSSAPQAQARRPTPRCCAGALAARMYGRERIEWQDRSWRLLANRGQVACDDLMYGRAVVSVWAALRGAGWRGVGVVGAAGQGSVSGTSGRLGTWFLRPGGFGE